VFRTVFAKPRVYHSTVSKRFGMLSSFALLCLLAFAPGEAFRVARERTGREVSQAFCIWRQTGQCSSTGPREPEKDETCNNEFNKAHSGFCDCNANNKFDSDEKGFDCSGSGNATCSEFCKMPTVYYVETKGAAKVGREPLLAPNSCPRGSRAMTEAECTQAASDLSLMSRGRVPNTSAYETRRTWSFPHGCYYERQQYKSGRPDFGDSWSGFVWNPDTPGGGASNTRTPICTRKTATTTTTTTTTTTPRRKGYGKGGKGKGKGHYLADLHEEDRDDQEVLSMN